MRRLIRDAWHPRYQCQRQQEDVDITELFYLIAGTTKQGCCLRHKENRDGGPGMRPTAVCRCSCQRSRPIATFPEESHHHRTLPRRAGIASELREGAEKTGRRKAIAERLVLGTEAGRSHRAMAARLCPVAQMSEAMGLSVRTGRRRQVPEAVFWQLAVVHHIQTL